MTDQPYTKSVNSLMLSVSRDNFQNFFKSTVCMIEISSCQSRTEIASKGKID